MASFGLRIIVWYRHAKRKIEFRTKFETSVYGDDEEALKNFLLLVKHKYDSFKKYVHRSSDIFNRSITPVI